MNKLIYGKDETTHVVSVEVEGDKAVIYREVEPGKIECETCPATHWILYPECHDEKKFKKLDGDLYYQWLLEYSDRDKYEEVLKDSYKANLDPYTVRDPSIAFMLREGVTYFNGMTVDEVSILSFDIEGAGFALNQDSEVFIITNTLRVGKEEIQRDFFLDEYGGDSGKMLKAWCEWVREVDPSIMTAHNIYGYDLPYLAHVASLRGVELSLGRDGSIPQFDQKWSNKVNAWVPRIRKFRKDGGQAYDFQDINIFGREIIDTMFMAIKYDIGRNFTSYKLKDIEIDLGLVENRQDWDFSKCSSREAYEAGGKLWAKFKEYARQDSKTPIQMFDIMIPSVFYYTQSMPRGLQEVVNTASGGQINAFMVRAYLQEGHSIPKKSNQEEYEGGISFGNPGIYKNVYKVDVASLYPSIMRQYRVYDEEKDPKGHFLRMVDYFTEERLANKKKAKETREKYYDDLQAAQKIVINSAYGFMGAGGLNFNSPENAAFVTRKGREILQRGIEWAESKGYQIVNADTDSFSYTGPKPKQYDFEADIEDLNTLYPEKIIWEDDGFYKTVIIVAAKNYILDTGKKVKTKGASIKATTKEPAFRDFINDVIELLLENKKDHLFNLYHRYGHRIMAIEDIENWCSKATITESVLKPKEKAHFSKKMNVVVKDREGLQQGDKVYWFYKTDTDIALREDFDGQYSRKRLHEKLYDTLCVFKNIIDVSLFPNYSLKKNKELL